jgi:hypothetical protein
MSKLIARVFGGLGNQLFIYATARALAERTGVTLALDTRSGFRHDAYERHFSLRCFDVQFEEANTFERFDYLGGRGMRYFIRKANRHLPFPRRFYLLEKNERKKSFMYELMSFQPSARTWLEGYWQSPAYFEDIRPILMQELQVKNPLSSQTLEMADFIRRTNSVCVHLRMLRHFLKGVENVADKKMDFKHYLQSMDFMAQKVDNPHFFCFSDNPDVMESLLKSPYDITFVTHNKGDAKAYEDFHLMSLCHHFILSNSTFAWWPAWLSRHPASIAISPPLHYWDNRDILPSHWLTSDKLPVESAHAV